MTLYHSNEPWHCKAKEKALVRWYSWARELESKHNPQRIKFDLQNEIIEDYRGIDIFIALETIIKKCRVIFATEEDPIDLIRRERLNRDLYFFCRYKIILLEIEPLFSPDSELDEREVFTTLSERNSSKSPLKRKISSNSDNESPSKSIRIASKMELLNITSPEQKKSVKRNLNTSFADSLSPEYGTPTLNYSIASPSSQSNESIKIKLKLSQKQNPQVVLKSLDDTIMQKYLNSDTKKNSDEENTALTLRRSSRTVQRKSYAELISPEKFIRECEAKAGEHTPSRRSRRNILSSPETNSTPTKMTSIGKRVTNIPGRYTEDIIYSSIRNSILKTTTTTTDCCQTPSKRVTLCEDYTPETSKRRKSVATPRSGLKSTPSARLKQIKEGTITPSIQKREQAVQKGDTPLIKARSQLHVSHIPDALPCREKEYSNILSFIEGKLVDGCGG